jgi:hypothetical protein
MGNRLKEETVIALAAEAGGRKVSKSELRDKVMGVIYGARWQVKLSGEADARFSGFDEFYMDDEVEVFDRICELLGVKVER